MNHIDEVHIEIYPADGHLSGTMTIGCGFDYVANTPEAEELKRALTHLAQITMGDDPDKIILMGGRKYFRII